ncbi:MAG: type II toxin-antitoxin system HicB family antitoxin [Acidobacteria bacterium]|nr:type II toxin-antitoxin system HicB family antitoxin [Acidobacteriota bacterium]
MKFRVVLEYDPEAESYSAVCPELPGCASAGQTEEEARCGIEEAIRLYLSPAGKAPFSKPGSSRVSPRFQVHGRIDKYVHQGLEVWHLSLPALCLHRSGAGKGRFERRSPHQGRGV